MKLLLAISSPGAFGDVAVSPCGRLACVALAGEGGAVYDLRTGERVAALAGGEPWSYRVAYGPSGRLLAASRLDGSVGVWDTATWEQVGVLQESHGGTHSLAFSHDGRLLLSCRTGTLWVHDLAVGRPRLVAMAEAVAPAPDGHWAVAAGYDWAGTVCLDTGVETRLWGPTFHNVCRLVRPLPDGSGIISVYGRNRVTLWRLGQDRPAWVVWPRVSTVSYLAVCPTGRTFAVAGHPRAQVRLVADGSLVGRSVAWCPRGIGFCPDGRRLVVSDLLTVSVLDTGCRPRPPDPLLGAMADGALRGDGLSAAAMADWLEERGTTRLERVHAWQLRQGSLYPAGYYATRDPD